MAMLCVVRKVPAEIILVAGWLGSEALKKYFNGHMVRKMQRFGDRISRK
jgi:hypothetical protein